MQWEIIMVPSLLFRILLIIAYLRMNCEPVSRMRDMLHQYFKPNIVERDFSLAISTGRNGARLTHNHARQFQFGISFLSLELILVDQSLTLWSIIMHDVYQMWY